MGPQKRTWLPGYDPLFSQKCRKNQVSAYNTQVPPIIAAKTCQRVHIWSAPEYGARPLYAMYIYTHILTFLHHLILKLCFSVRIAYKMSEFPCIECTLECNEDTIQCSNCKKWLHRQCTNLNTEEYKSWSDRNLNYLCKCCAFRGTDYDAEGSLTR